MILEIILIVSIFLIITIDLYIKNRNKSVDIKSITKKIFLVINFLIILSSVFVILINNYSIINTSDYLHLNDTFLFRLLEISFNKYELDISEGVILIFAINYLFFIVYWFLFLLNYFFNFSLIGFIKKRPKNIVLFFILLIITKVPIHYFLFTSCGDWNSYIGSCKEYENFAWHFQEIFNEEGQLFFLSFLIIGFISWYFSDKIKAK